jgi:hypothetical protein
MEPYAPIRYPEELTHDDPLIRLSNVLATLEEGECVRYIVYVSDFDPEAYHRELKKITQSNARAGCIAGMLNLVGGMLSMVSNESRGEQQAGTGMIQIVEAVTVYFGEAKSPERRAPKFVNKLQETFWNKIARPLFHTYLFLQIDTPDAQRVAPLLIPAQSLLEYQSHQHLDTVDNPETDSPIKVNSPREAQHTHFLSWAYAHIDARDQNRLPKESPPLFETTCLFNAAEIGSLWHMPDERFLAPTIAWAQSTVTLPHALTTNVDGVILGSGNYSGKFTEVTLPYASRNTHLAVFGRTRMGKSNFLHHLIHQDIANGYGVAVIDPQGALVRDILRYSIPESREQDVILCEITSEAHPIPLNLLSSPEGVPIDTAVSQLYALLERYGDFGTTLTLRPAVWNSLLLLRYETTPTIRDIYRVLTQERYRNSLRARAEKSPVSEDYWAAFERKSPSEREKETVGPLTERLTRFYNSNRLYAMTCHPDSLDFASHIAEGKIILLSLQDEQSQWVESQLHLLGGTFVSQILLSATRRGVGGKPFFLYIDEVDAFISSPLDTILSKAGKYNLSLTTASQMLGQLRGKTLEAVMGNVSNLAVFRVGYEDARDLSVYLPGFEPETLTALPAFSCASVIQRDTATYAFSLYPQAPMQGHVEENDVPQSVKDREAYLRQISQARYVPKTDEEVQAWLAARYKKSPIPPAPKSAVDPDEFLEN